MQHFLNLHVSISWQVQHFVHLQVQISLDSGQPEYKMRCGENREGTKMLYFSMEPVAEKLASQGLRNDRCEAVSGHARIMLGIVIEVVTVNSLQNL